MALFRSLHAKFQIFFSGRGGGWRLAALGALGVIGFLTPSIVRAGSCGLGSPESCIAMIFVWIFQILTSLMGFILIMEVDALIKVAQYFNFVSPGPTAVQIGWKVTRDLANMFFIVLLLIIAFSTAIGYAKYHYEKNLGRLLIMAVVINFSKTLCGLMIDASQVIMLSFVNGFKAAAAGNFFNAFQISKLLDLANGSQGYDFGLVLAMMLAFILAAISASIVLIMLVMMVYRVIMLWVLIIMSPLAFLTKAVEGSSYYSQWWGELKKYLTGGPIIAFFLWLALATAQQTAGNLSSASEGWGVQSTATASEVSGQGQKLGITNNAQIPSEAGRSDTILSMVIVICILFAGLKFASDPSIAGLAADFGKKVSGKVQGALKGAAYGTAKYAASPIMNTGGKMLAKVPLVGGLGRMAVLTSEKWKKERQAGLEKYFGSMEDKARLSPGAFKREMTRLSVKPFKDDIDKKRLSAMIKTGLADPRLAASLGGKDGVGASALGTLIGKSKGKDLQDAAGLMMNDKNAKAWAKAKPAALVQAYEKLKSEWKDKNGNVLDANMGKTVSEFEQKFAPQLLAEGAMDPAKLQDLVPKMSSDDIGDIDDAKTMALFMPHMNNSQFRKILQDGKPKQIEAMGQAFTTLKNNALNEAGADPDKRKRAEESIQRMLSEKGVNAGDLTSDQALPLFKNPDVALWALQRTTNDAKTRGELMANKDRADALRGAAETGLETARNEGQEDKIAAASVQAMTVGALKATDLAADLPLLRTIAGNVDTAQLARGINKDDPDQLAAARAVFKSIMDQDPMRVRNLSKNDLYNKLLPSKAEIDSAVTGQSTASRNLERAGLVGDANAVVTDLQKQLQGLQDAIHLDQAAGQSTETKEQLRDEVARALQELTQVTNRRAAAEQELAREMSRLQTAPAGTDTTAIERAIDTLRKAMEKMDSNLAKQVATLQGKQFNDGTGGQRRNRGGGGRTP